MINLNASGRKTAEKEAEQEVRREREREVFRRKVAIQQFMNHNAPLFRAFARKGEDVSKVIEGGVLKEPARLASRLAVTIAARVHGKEASDLSAADVRPFRSEAAEYVASRWVAGRKIDIDKAADEVASAVELADGSWDHDVYRDDRLSDDTSLMMTVVGVTGTLSRLVNIYDFRLGKTEALSRLMSTIVDISVKTAKDMLKDTAATDTDERNLTQTLARNFASLMEVCYDRKAKEVSIHLKDMSPDEKRAFYSMRSPMDEVIADFREWYVCFSGWAVMATREIAPHTAQGRTPG